MRIDLSNFKMFIPEIFSRKRMVHAKFSTKNRHLYNFNMSIVIFEVFI